MKSSKSTTAHSSAPTSGTRRSQPLRTTRNNPPRVSVSGARNYASKASLSAAPVEAPIEIFPAITHFADAISALPKELVRHFTLLKEVDAKIFLPEEELTKLVNEALNVPLPPRPQAGDTKPRHGHGSTPLNAHVGYDESFTNGCGISAPDVDTVWDPSNMNRRQLFNKCALTMQGMLVSLDEKNHVISTAGEALAKQLVRIDDCLPFIELEVSEEARNGSTTHWAYPENRIPKASHGGNPRKEPQSSQLPATAQHLAEEAAARSDARKQALLEKRKSKNQHIDSDFDDQSEIKHKDKKPNGKARKVADAPAGVAIGTLNGGTPNGNISKRRKVEKCLASSTASERPTNSVSTGNGTASKGKPSSPRSTPQPEGSRKRLRAAPASANGSVNRKRSNTVNSIAKSPPLASSPIQTTFLNSQASRKPSPPPSNSRLSSVRCRQNSIQPNIDNHPPSPSQIKLSSNSTPEFSNNMVLTGKLLSETTPQTTEYSTNRKGEHLPSTIEQHESKIGGGPILANKGGFSGKRELSEVNGDAVTAILNTTITTTKSGRTSKPSTPGLPSFPETVRSRSSRTPHDIPTGKRGHNKGVGATTQHLVAQNMDAGDVENREGEDDEEFDANEPRYCYCDNVSYGEMVGCDAEGCKREWFHLNCVGLKTAPKGNTKWYCEDCKDIAKGKRFSSSR